MRGSRTGVASSPEFNVAVFALLLNFPWEFLQTPLYARMPTVPHWEAIKVCTRATLGDVVITLVAFAAVALATRDRRWIEHARTAHVTAFALIGVVLTAAIEWLAITGKWIAGWSYAATMPTIPWLHVGLAPLAQWVVLPPLVAWFTKRQLRGAG
jgi:hypothetical protein